MDKSIGKRHLNITTNLPLTKKKNKKNKKKQCGPTLASCNLQLARFGAQIFFFHGAKRGAKMFSQRGAIFFAPLAQFL